MPIIVTDVIQGSDAWHKLRLGIPTASGFKYILTGTGKRSDSYKGYADQLIADHLAGQPTDDYKSADMARGNELEESARQAYEFQTGLTTEQVGFVFLDVRENIGCSPDSLVEEDGLLEIKNRKAKNLVNEYSKGYPTSAIPQLQGQIWVCDRKWVDYYSSHPMLMPYMVRVERDDNYIALLAEAVAEFVEYLNKRKKALKKWRM